MMMTELSLRYIVELAQDSNPRDFRKRVSAGIETSLVESGTTTRQQTTRVIPIERQSFFLELGIQFSTRELLLLGPSILMQVMLGNAFRSPDVRSLVLVDFHVSDRTDSFPGPQMGADFLVKSLVAHHGAIAFPVPSGLGFAEWQALVEAGVAAGINIFCDSPFSGYDDSVVVSRAQHLASVRSDHPIAYFFAGNGPINRLGRILEALCQLPQSNSHVGIRVCPWSVGFEVVNLIRQSKLPLLAYSMIDFGGRATGGKSISQPSSLLLQRYLGADIIAVGLTTEEAIADPSAEYATRCSERLQYADGSTVTRSAPLFAGDLSPRKACALTRAHGSQVVLHAKKPLLRPIPGRGGQTQSVRERLQFNVAAFREGMKLGLSDEDANVAFENAKASVATWMKYEKQ